MPIEFNEETARSLERSYRTPEIAKQRQYTLNSLELQPGKYAIDIGCGPGFLVKDIAGIVGPGGYAIGVDNSSPMLYLARTRTKALAQVKLIKGALQNLPFADNTFDALACIQLLLFINNVSQSLQEMYRILKPGGRIAIIETDWRSVVLNAKDDTLTRRMFAAWNNATISPNLPVKLKPKLYAAGFKDVTITGIPILNTDFNVETFSFDMLHGVAHEACEMGAVTKAEGEEWIAEMQKKDANGAYFFCVNRFLFTGSKANTD